MEKPSFELTNEQRKYLGLIPIEKKWEMVKLDNGIYLYFDGDTIRKTITVGKNSYLEQELNEKTAENRTILLPKTPKGKPKKLNTTATRSFNPFGVYFEFSKNSVSIANHTTQTRYYSEQFEKEKSFKDLKGWLDKWISKTNKEDLKEIEKFKIAERKHCKFKEGDFFAFKFGRRQWGFGRILMDVSKRIKTGNLKEGKNYGLTHLMGKALIVKVYHKLSEKPEADLEVLSKTMALPSQNVMDNHYYYGENIIIGHKSLEMEEYEMPISYGQSIDVRDENTVYLQYGLIYKETNISKFDKYLKVQDQEESSINKLVVYRNESVGFGLNTEKLEECIAKKSNQPYWDSGFYKVKYDLRSPANLEAKREIFKFFELDADKNYEENFKIAYG